MCAPPPFSGLPGEVSSPAQVTPDKQLDLIKGRKMTKTTTKAGFV